jgi:hypothetical protein
MPVERTVDISDAAPSFALTEPVPRQSACSRTLLPRVKQVKIRNASVSAKTSAMLSLTLIPWPKGLERVFSVYLACTEFRP